MARSAAVMASVLLLLGAAAGMAQQARSAPSFGLAIPGMIAATFQACEGLGSTTAVIEYRDGGTGETRKLPGMTKWSDITLKRGVSADGSLAAWRKLVEEGDVAGSRKNGSLVVYDPSGKSVARYHLTDAWPSKVSIDTDPETGQAIETLVLTVETSARE